jgi:hypothetical protein
MTRKDYILIAAAIKRAWNAEIGDATKWSNIGVEIVALALADALAKGNPLFDRERFLKATGVPR